MMREDYDALQTWPFQKKITMMLLDQGNGDHMIGAFHLDPQSSSFQRYYLMFMHALLFSFKENIVYYIIIRVRSAFSLVASCVLLKYTRTDDVN